MKTSKDSTKLNSLQEMLSLIYDIDPKDSRKLARKELECIILYYLGDMQYVLYKKGMESELGKDLTEEELNNLLRANKLPNEINVALTDEELCRISVDADYLNKYNSLQGDERILKLLTLLYAGSPTILIDDKDFLNNIKKHQIMEKLGIRKYLRLANRALDEKLEERQLERQRQADSYKDLISTITVTRHAK